MVSPQKFSTYIRKPYALDAEAEQQLRDAIQKYPYFSNAWLLLTRSLHNQNSPKFDASLEQAGMYAGDRDLLYKLVNINDSDDEKKPLATESKAAPLATEIPAQKTEQATTTEAPKQEPETQTHTETATTPKDTVEQVVEEETTKEEVLEDLTINASTENETATPESAITENTVDPIPQDTIEETVEADATTKGESSIEELTENLEAEITDNADESVEAIDAEQEKVKSAYEEIFGSQEDNGHDSISNEFETFDIKDRVIEEEPALPDFDEEDFVLQVDDNESEVVLTDVMASATLENNLDETAPTVEDPYNDNIDTNTIENTTAEQVYTPQANTNESERILADEMASATLENNLDETTPAVEEPNSDNLETNTLENTTTEQEFTETINTLPEEPIESPEIESQDAPVTATHTTVDAEENTLDASTNIPKTEEAPAENELHQPIDFKLENTEVLTEEAQESTEQIATEPQPSHAATASSFFEWLTQLNNPEATAPIQKKNEITETAISTSVSQSQQPPIFVSENSTEELSKKKTNADDIIERFIKINPTISRPKAEFYNPEAKSKESDTESDDLATETLAKIYRDQNLNDKAIEVYQRLIVLYPAKAAEYTAIIAELENE